MQRKTINEEDGLHKEWYKEAKEQTLETLPEFIKKLTENYEHDYGTICHAITSAAIGTAWAINDSSQGGITGFQAGAIMWEFIKHWNHEYNKLGLKLIDYDNILFPQYEYRFKNEISKKHWKKIQNEALNRIKQTTESGSKVHKDVMDHWKSIADGNLPFNFVITDEK